MLFSKHIVGIGLLVLALSSLMAMTSLPSSSGRPLSLPFLPDTGSTVHLVFAGFPACGTLCPTSLHLLNDVVTQLEISHQTLVSPDVTFINLQIDTPRTVTEEYVKSWNSSFNGYSIASPDAQSLFDELALVSYTAGQDPRFHSGYIYLFYRVDNHWAIAKVYQKTPTKTRIIKDVLGLSPVTF